MNSFMGIVLLLPIAHVIASGHPNLVYHEIGSVEITLDGRPGPIVVNTDNRMLIRDLAILVSQAEPGNDHKCRDIGQIQFVLQDGSTIRVGLLPAHREGAFNLRFYSDGGYTVGEVDRDVLLNLLERAGIPARDPAFPG